MASALAVVLVLALVLVSGSRVVISISGSITKHYSIGCSYISSCTCNCSYSYSGSDSDSCSIVPKMLHISSMPTLTTMIMGTILTVSTALATAAQ